MVTSKTLQKKEALPLEASSPEGAFYHWLKQRHGDMLDAMGEVD